MIWATVIIMNEQSKNDPDVRGFTYIVLLNRSVLIFLHEWDMNVY